MRMCIIGLVCSVMLLGCPNEKAGKGVHSLKKPADAMPAEGWATDPNFSYRYYSYYPIDYVHGGVYQPYYHMPIPY